MGKILKFILVVFLFNLFCINQSALAEELTYERSKKGYFTECTSDEKSLGTCTTIIDKEFIDLNKISDQEAIEPDQKYQVLTEKQLDNASAIEGPEDYSTNTPIDAGEFVGAEGTSTTNEIPTSADQPQEYPCVDNDCQNEGQNTGLITSEDTEKKPVRDLSSLNVDEDDRGPVSEDGKSEKNNDRNSNFSLNEAIKKCEEFSVNAGNCCSSTDLANSTCVSDDLRPLLGLASQIQQAAQNIRNSSVAGSCANTKDSARLATALNVGVTAMCTKKVGECVSACSTEISCSNYTGTSPAAIAECEKNIRKLRNTKILCGGYLTLNTGMAAINIKAMKELDKAAASCEERATANQDCTELGPEETLANLECDPSLVCSNTAYQQTQRCIDFNRDPGPGPGSVELTSTINLDEDVNTDGLDDDCGQAGCPEDENDNRFDSPFGGDGGANSASSGGGSGGGGGGGIPGGSGGGGGGGSGGSGGGGGGKTADRNIIKGSSSGNGYVSRFRGGGGGGSYRNAVRSGGGGRRTPASAGFNLNKFLPKSKRITKGAFKNYQRLPNGQLMAPQSLDIFSLHHKSYTNACLKNQAIKGCDSISRKKLGLKVSVSDLGSSYRSQMFLAKELNHQKANKSNVKVKSISNYTQTSARKTYYQMQYMKTNRISTAPLNLMNSSSSQLNAKAVSSESKKWNKMKSWVNAKAVPAGASKPQIGKKPTSLRLPASKGR